jgi:hypothetical protein
MEVEPLPIPVTQGPVEPPKARPAPWVYVLIGLFILGTLLAFVTTMLRWWPKEEPVVTVEPQVVATEGEAELSDEGTPEPSATEPAPQYSYTSVSREVIPSDHYSGIAEECFNIETNALSPSIDRPATVAEKTSLVMNVAIDRTEDLPALSTLVDIANAHKIKLTIFVSPAFVTAANEQTILEVAAWVKQGHEIGLTVDRAELFPESDSESEIPYGSWLLTLHEFQIEAEALCSCSIVTFADGTSFDRIFEVADELDFVAHASPRAPIAYQPWTPAVGGSDASLTSFDVFGSVVQVPKGIYPAHCEDPDVVETLTDVSFSYVTRALYETMRTAEKGRVNVISLMIDLSTITGVSDEDPYGPIKTWLTTVVDREIRSARLVPARSTDISDAYFSWLDLNFQNIEFVRK